MDHKDTIILVLTLACLLMTVLGICCGWCFGAASVYREWGESTRREAEAFQEKWEEITNAS